ncbi:cysteine hydrolase family protein [Oryzifoliimicrobium ureilyticus]|uniref:cysteine hydrolase family protein n=1 Tax=Oryzifoliimicrobium ureilyticus TaxID=3113724 RepID=UPI0030760DD1
MVEPADKTFKPVTAQPYAWPFDGCWSANDTVLFLLGFQHAAVAKLGAEAELATATDLLKTAMSHGLATVAVRRGYGPHENPMAARRRILGDAIPQYGSEEWRMDERLSLSAETIIIDIAGDNAFFDTGLEATLRQRGIRNLLITGLPTEGLVHATQRAANDMGFECLTVSDACKGTSSARHSAQLQITTFGNGLFGTVATSTDVHAALKNL